MNRLSGIPSLNAGAPDLRLTGEHNRGSYVQRRRAQMAGGGIMGSNAGSMLVAPTADGSRPGYWGLDDLWNVAKKVGQTIVPGGETGYFDLYGGLPQLPKMPDQSHLPPDERDPNLNLPTKIEEPTTSSNPLWEFLKKTGQTIMPGGDPGYIDLYGGTGDDPGIARQVANIAVPLGVGKWAHD